MIMGKFFLFLGAGFFAVFTFLLGNIFLSNPPDRIRDNKTALINNSLINRFTRPVEKYKKLSGPVNLSREAALSPKLSPDGRGILYYTPRTGQLNFVSWDPFWGRGISPMLVSEVRAGLDNIIWSPSAKEIIAQLSDNFIYYNLPGGNSEKLDQNIRTVAFVKSASANSIGKRVYLAFDSTSGEGTIETGDLETKSSNKILNTRNDNWVISAVNDRFLSLVSINSQKSIATLFTAEIDSKNLTKILEAPSDLLVNWSPNGIKLLYSFTPTGANTSTLYVHDTANGMTVSLDKKIPADRCLWETNSPYIYCVDGQKLIKIDASSPKKEEEVLGRYPILEQARDLLLDTSNSYLVFRNPVDSFIYGLNINR